jgi:hypothetical protein
MAPWTCPGYRFLFAILVTGVSFSLCSVVLYASPARPATGQGCVWLSGLDTDEVDQALAGWQARHSLPAMTDWGLAIESETLRLTLESPGGPTVLDIRASENCQATPEVSIISKPKALELSAPVLADLVRVLPARRGPAKAPVAKNSASSSVRAVQSGPDTPAWMEVLVSILFILLAFRLVPNISRASHLRALTVGGIGALLTAYVAWPMLNLPLDECGAASIRALFALNDVFGDAGHPPLLFILISGATRISFEPWAFRLVPFIFLLLEVSLAGYVATRRGGGVAGAFVGLWFAGEVPRRNGFLGISDWDLAATFLLSWLLWVMAVELRDLKPGKKQYGILAALVVLGIGSSWLMMVPALVLGAILLWSRLLGSVWIRRWWSWGVVLLAVLASVGLAWFYAVERGDESLSLVAQMIRLADASVLGRSFWFAPLLLAGIYFSLKDGRVSSLLIVGQFVAIPLGILVIGSFSPAAGYYQNLATPLSLVIAAAGAGWIAESCGQQAVGWWTRKWGSKGRKKEIVKVVSLALMVLLVVLSTIAIPNTRGGYGAHKHSLLECVRHIGTNDVPIVANNDHMWEGIVVAQLRLGLLSREDISDLRIPSSLQVRLHRIDLDNCKLEPDWEEIPGRFFLLVQNVLEFDPDSACVARLAAGCSLVVGEPGTETLIERSARGVHLLECTAF